MPIKSAQGLNFPGQFSLTHNGDVAYIKQYKQMNQNQTIAVAVETVQAQKGVQILGFPIHYLGILFLALVALAYRTLVASKRRVKQRIVLVGERNSGKTQLFIQLNGGKKMKTSPSIQNNKTGYEVGGRRLEMVDYIGDNISKEEVIASIEEILCIVHVIDGTDSKSLSDAAMFLYKVLVSKGYQKNECEYVLFLNKSDATGFMGAAIAQKILEDEIENIKYSRINQGEENENEDDYIKLSKSRFKLAFKLVEGSAEHSVKDLQAALADM